MIQSIDEPRSWANGIVARLLNDPTFREAVIENPERTLRGEGFAYSIGDSGDLPPLPLFAAKPKKGPSCKCTSARQTCASSCMNSCHASCKQTCAVTEKM